MGWHQLLRRSAQGKEPDLKLAAQIEQLILD